ncbi:hypothetical protein GF325_04670 [Candidatus Bathyarchaeota archaeon]|nr:hypothetical protein [Candidatus Bathyarchaeota archaeon]
MEVKFHGNAYIFLLVQISLQGDINWNLEIIMVLSGVLVKNPHPTSSHGSTSPSFVFLDITNCSKLIFAGNLPQFQGGTVGFEFPSGHDCRCHMREFI